ncbi:MAG: class II fructose-bisphosphate aldolase [Patescibacteria group bacterium]
MLVSSRSLLLKAQKGGYAIGAFNIDNLEMVQAVVRAAINKQSPAIIATSESSIAYAGGPAVLKALVSIVTQGRIPFVLHLDHGKDIALIKQCIDIGWTSVMYDGSLLPYDQNIKNTQEVVAYAHKHHVSVEAELGALKVQEDGETGAEQHFTDPDQADVFVRTTGVDSLAIAIGTSHGAFKAKGDVRLDYSRLKKIQQRVRVPLVLHGASTLSRSLQKKMHKNCEDLNDCLRLEGAHGIRPSAIRKCISLGIAKVNVGTDLRASFVAGIRESIIEHPTSYDERDFFKDARNLIQKTIEERMVLLSSAGKAK